MLPDMKKTDLSINENANALSANLIVVFTIIADSFPGGNRTNVSPLEVNTDPYALLRLAFDSSTENSFRFVHPWNILVSIFSCVCLYENLKLVSALQLENAEFPILIKECSKTESNGSEANDDIPIDSHELGKTTLYSCEQDEKALVSIYLS